MAFQYENQMAEPAECWLREQGLMVKQEFPTPWGICDLVGCSLNKNKVRQRLARKQTKPIRSQLRVHLLSLIPDETDRATVTIKQLHEHFGGYLDRGRIELEVSRLARDRFIYEASPGTYFKRNGWMPLHKRLVAVELKLARIDDALNQAINNLGLADESYVGLPVDRAERLIESKRRHDFANKGVGILAVQRNGCKVVLRPRKQRPAGEKTVQAYSVERFWLPYLKDNEA
ncbi:MAG: hypothetical protein JW993_02080 [Sedimentisphaerales bacterium]|nr:hypothetical protein [Sedimentisphaerales bacterium]